MHLYVSFTMATHHAQYDAPFKRKAILMVEEIGKPLDPNELAGGAVQLRA